MPVTVPALWTRHRAIAYKQAGEFRIPGLQAQDVEQEALVALWEACRRWDPERGKFPPFAKAVIRNTLIDLLRRASHRPVEVPLEIDVRVEPETGQLRWVLEALDTLTELERQAVADHLNGRPSKESKSHDSALDRARVKLRAA